MKKNYHDPTNFFVQLRFFFLKKKKKKKLGLRVFFSVNPQFIQLTQTPTKNKQIKNKK
jgi:hypothetical protein